jgi:DNA-directed RNA polymerase specialized sigma subunit
MDTYREDNHFPEHLLEYAMSTLTDRERYVIERFYFDNKILDVIGKELGVSKSRATQLRISGLAKLRRQLVGRNHLDIKDFDFDSDAE